MSPIIHQLETLGLNEKEAKVYLASLETGPATIAIVSRKAGIKRPTAYYVLASLIEKGMLTKVPKGKRVLYRAESPKKFRTLTAKQNKTIDELLPSLESQYRKTFKFPKITFHEDRDGILEVYQNFFSTHETLWALVSIDDFYEFFTEKENAEFFRLLKDHGGYLYDIFLNSPRAEKIKQQPFRKAVSRTKILPPSFTSPIDILVSSHRVAMVSFPSRIAVVIEDESIARAQKMLLQSLWKHAT